MSVNKYNHTSGELTILANGSRCWIGTKAAYDAEKQAGTLPVNCLIAITDDSEDNNYSTEEKLTGKFWIDGKPIYRKSGYVNSGTVPSILDASLTTSYVDVPINVEASVLDGSSSWLFFQGYNSNNDRGCMSVRSNGFQILSGVPSGLKAIYWSLEYTKKDD